MLTYTAEILNAATGEGRVTEPSGFDEDGTVLCWQEGNFCCDCNRKQFWLEAGNEYPDDLDEDADRALLPCGKGGFVVRELKVSDGRAIPIDNA